MKEKMMAIVAMLSIALLGRGETTLATASSSAVSVDTTFVDGSSINSTIRINYGSVAQNEDCVVSLNGAKMVSANRRGSYTWQPQKTGAYTLVWSLANVAMTSKVSVASLAFAVAPTPNPPMAKNSAISITPTSRNFPFGGGGNAIITSGSGTWTAAVSDSWITLNATSGNAGYPVAYTVSANPDVEDRVGYVYVAGYTHTITQTGLGCTVNKTNVDMEREGGTGTVTITPVDMRSGWKARSNCDWISISPTSGTGTAMVSYQVAPWYDVSTRSGTITVGDKTVTVFQYGSRMKLNRYSEICDYFTHVIPITVNALAVTSWSVKQNASWISVVDAGNGKGGDTVSIAVGENPSYKERTGTVTIGTETFTVMQKGRTALSFSINPTSATASVTGGNGVLAVNATPDLPWTAKSGANWLTIMSGYTSGAGNGNVVYNASPNSTLSQRTGKITVTPGDSSLIAKTLTVSQPGAVATISKSAHEFPAAGGSVVVDVTVGGIVEWSISESISWLSVEGSTSRVGPGTVVLSAAANNTVYPRSGTLTIAGKTFTVSQKARGVELEYESKVFGTDGGMESISIHPDGNVSWTAVASDNWIVVFQNASGTGDSEIIYILAPYEGDGSPRTGWITIGDKKVYITQRAYDVDITPRAKYVSGNSGAGEIGVSAGIGDVWQAIIEAPWIKIITGYDAGTGNGTVRFTYTENNTGLTRTGKIVIAGEVYTLTQAARIPVAISAEVEGHGTVSGAGEYTLGDKVSLQALPDAGYEFLYWTGDCGESMQNPLPVTADVAKRVTAHFGPLTPEFTKTEVSTEGVKLTWRGLAWATQYKIYRAPTDVFPSVALVTLDASKGTSWQDTTGDVGKTYFYWVEAIGADDTTECKDATSGAKQKPIVYSSITYTNLKGATHANPATYQEGTTVSFTAPSAVTGYTFSGWTPSAITATMTGSQAVMANWKANTYTIAYNANGGLGTMAGTSATYDQVVTLAACGFTYEGRTFAGWATDAAARPESVPYHAGDTVRNLSALQGGVVTLYAIWEDIPTVYSEITYTNLMGATHTNPGLYEEGTMVSFTAPSAVTGYTFSGWTPSEIAATMTGAQTVMANWKANTYTIAYNANGGSGRMASTSATYGQEMTLSACAFALEGCVFAGWALSPDGEVAHTDGDVIQNLASNQGEVVTLYAVWKLQEIPEFVSVESSAWGVSLIWDCIGWATEYRVYRSESVDSEKVLVAKRSGPYYNNYPDATGWPCRTYYYWLEVIGRWRTMSTCVVTGSKSTNDQSYLVVLSEREGKSWDRGDVGRDHKFHDFSTSDDNYLEETVCGPCQLSFKWYCDQYETSGNGSRLTLIVDGVEDLCFGNLSDFDVATGEKAITFVDEGLHTVRWQFEVDREALLWLDRVWRKVEVSKITYVNLQGATHANPASYCEGSTVSFVEPSAVEGYTFVGWTPNAITSTMTGSQTVRANWNANAYTIVYNANGGSGTMSETSATYDQDVTLATCAFAREGYAFAGWAWDESALPESSIYRAGEAVRNLTALQDGVVTLYAVWDALPPPTDAEDPLTGGTGVAKFGGVVTDNTLGWTVVERADAKLGSACLRGTMTEAYDEVGDSTCYAAKVKGEGTLSFWWKTSCEEDPAGDYTWDHAECWVDDHLVAQVDGEPDWQEVEVGISGEGDHIIAWMYVTDGYAPEIEGLEECVLIDGLSWTGEAYVLEPLANPVISPADGSTFTTGTCTVTITCETPDAIIYYSTNGRTPSVTETARYKGAFKITKTTTVKAVAVRGSEKSEYVSATITKKEPKLEDVSVGKEVTGRDELVTVPASWVTEALVARFGEGKADAFKQQFGLDLAAALVKPTGKVNVDGRAMTVWNDYVAGTDPTDPTSRLKTVIKIVDGKVRVSWEPNLNDGAAVRSYKLWGRSSLEGGDWHHPAKDGDRFFKVDVDLPTGEETDAPSEFVPGVEPDLGGVQLWEGGPYWAECNVGAEQPEDPGYYFWWGDTVGYKRNAENTGWVSVKDGSAFSFVFANCPTSLKNESALKSQGYVDSAGNLVAKCDAATAHLGAPWRMPTSAEWEALSSNCTTTWTTRNGVYGWMVTGKGAYEAKSIFLPAAGYGISSGLYSSSTGSYSCYWSSTPLSGDTNDAWYLGFDSGNFSRSYGYRYYGQSVRPLRGFAK